VYACSKQGRGFPTPICRGLFSQFNCLNRYVIFHFVDMDGSVDITVHTFLS